MTESKKWRKAWKKQVEIEYREVEPQVHIRTKMPERKEIWGESIETREGLLFGYPEQDYIIRGIEGEIYPIKKTIFDKTYTLTAPSDSERRLAEYKEMLHVETIRREASEKLTFQHRRKLAEAQQLVQLHHANLELDERSGYGIDKNYQELVEKLRGILGGGETKT